MDRAISLYLIDPSTGIGAEFEANECKHGDCEALGLVCPICYESLFLKEGHYFNSKTGKLSIRPQHFCHHKAGPNSLDCEKRTASKEGREYQRLRRIYPRGQTLEKFNRKLWAMILQDNNILLGAREDLIRRAGGVDPVCVIKKQGNIETDVVGGLAVARLLQEQLNVGFQSLVGIVNTIIDNLYNPPEEIRNYQLQHLSPKAYQNYREYASTNQLFHRAICHEVLEFLKTDSAGYTRLQLVYGAFWAQVAQQEAGLSLDTAVSVITNILALIANVYWNWVIPSALTGEYDHLIEEYNLERIMFEREAKKKTKGKGPKRSKGFGAITMTKQTRQGA